MNIDVTWLQPIELRAKGSGYPIYGCDIDSFPESHGVYVFCRKHGESVKPIYIGQARNLRKRIEQQFNNARLMVGVKECGNASRIILVGTIAGRYNEQKLDLLERALISHALSEGHDLINVQGTRTPVHTISFQGNRVSEKVAPRTMHVKAR